MVAVRFGLLAIAASAALEVVAQPHGKRGHAIYHRKRDIITVTSTKYVYANAAPTPPASSPSAGYPVGGGATNIQVPPTDNGPAADDRQGSNDDNNANDNNNGQPEAPSKNPKGDQGNAKDQSNNSGVTDGKTKNKQGSSSSSSGYATFPKTVVVSPYDANSQCREQNDLCNEMSEVKQQLGAEAVRIYGTDCKQVLNVLTCAEKLDMKVMLGIFDVSDDAVNTAVGTIKNQAKGHWDRVLAINVGNEIMNAAFLRAGGDGGGPGALDAARKAGEQCVKARNSAKAQLQANFPGPYISTDTFNMVVKIPEFGCQDDAPYIATNCHPFFAGIEAKNAGSYVRDSCVKPVSAACKKPVVISETGWPHQGATNGMAVPSKQDQQIAVSAICNTLGEKDVILLGGTDDLWKPDNAATHNAEKFWGILNN